MHAIRISQILPGRASKKTHSARREAEILVLRHQINVLRRRSPNRPALSNVDRLLFVLLSQLVPSTLDACLTTLL
jgi:hypothetical protein